MFSKNFETIKEGMEELKRAVDTRNKMGGALYWSIINDECCQIGNKIMDMGGNKEKVSNLLANY